MQMVLTQEMKMADLVEANFHLLPLFARFGIKDSFGEKTVAEVCSLKGYDPQTFTLICNAYTVKNFKPSASDIYKGDVNDIVRYLHVSHEYYLETGLVTLESELRELLTPCTEVQSRAVWKFFKEYEAELRKHFAYEETTVFPYIDSLRNGTAGSHYSITEFEHNHSNIDEKLGDLKNIIMKSLPASCDGDRRTDLLLFIYHLQEDLARHTAVEENIMVPFVHYLENPRAWKKQVEKEKQLEAVAEGNELSDREKEILVSVSQGLLNKEIADKHNISIHTVISHRKNITRKTGIKTVAGLTVYAILNNLIDINTVE